MNAPGRLKHHGTAMALVTCVWLGGLPAAAEEARTFSAAAPGPRLDDGGGEGERVAVAPGLASKLLTVELEGAARIHDWPVAPGLRRSILVRRHDIYDRTARVVVVEGDRLVDVPRSPVVFLWGSIEGDEGGSVLLTVDPRTMTVEATSETGSGSWRLASEADGSHLLLQTRSTGTTSWACGVGCDDGDGATADVRTAVRPPAPRPISVLHTASVAVETDNELMNLKFANNTTNALNYIAQLFAEMNVMYERDLLVRLLQGFTILRPSTTPDPYSLGPGGDGRARREQLEEFAGYWDTNFGGIKRALVTMLSGKQTDGSTSGYSWVSSLCVTQAIGGSYNFNQVYVPAPPLGFTDAREVGHEIGHNFGTRHTHCPPHSPFADQCWSGEPPDCYSGLTSCPAPQTYSGLTGVRGTIMSWCDRRPEQDCPVTNVFHPQTIAIIQPRIDAAVAICVFPFNAGVPPPVPSSITPTIGPIDGGTSVTVTGTGFQTGAMVTLANAAGSASLTSVTVVNATTITGTTTAHAAGAVDLVVSNPDQQSRSLAGAFTYRTNPTITAVVPNGGPTTGGTEVTVTGTGFVAPATLTLGGAPATGVTVVSPTSITATTAAHPVGIVDVSVGLPGGLSGTMASGYFYTPVSLPVAFYTLPPCRLVDTRGPSTPLGGPALAPAERRTFWLEGVCGLPAAAKAVSVNLTVVQPTNPGFMTLYPSDGLSPVASNLNFSPGQTRANNAVLVLATDGSDRLTVFNGSNGTAHFILDVNGYFK